MDVRARNGSALKKKSKKSKTDHTYQRVELGRDVALAEHAHEPVVVLRPVDQELRGAAVAVVAVPRLRHDDRVRSRDDAPAIAHDTKKT